MIIPTMKPSTRRTIKPNAAVSLRPTHKPTRRTTRPSKKPSLKPFIRSTNKPTRRPSNKPTVRRMQLPTKKPSVRTIMTDENIHDAAYLWVTNKPAAMAKYHHFLTWDTSRVTNMDSVFGYYSPSAGPYYDFWATTFNADLSAWNTGRVTSMYDMFDGAHSFNCD